MRAARRHGPAQLRASSLGGGVVVLVSAPARRPLRAQGRGSLYPEDFNAYLRIARERPGDRLHRQDRDGPGRDDLAGADGGRGARRRSRRVDHGARATPTSARGTWGTFGSLTTRMFGPALRAAAAAGARGADRRSRRAGSGVPREQLVVENGVVSVAGDRRGSVTYGELAQGKRIARTVGETGGAARGRRVPGDGHVAAAARRAREGDGRGEVRGGHPTSGHALRARSSARPPHGAWPKARHVAAARAVPGVTVVEARRPRRRPARRPGDRREGAGGRSRPTGTSAGDASTPTPSSTTSSKRRRRPEERRSRGDLAARAASAGADLRSDLPQGLRRPRADGAARRPGRVVTDGKATVWASTQTPFPDPATASPRR